MAAGKPKRKSWLKPEHKQVFSAWESAPETVEMLRECGWARRLERQNNLELHLFADGAANLLLGVLAEERSSPTMPPVTGDQGSLAASCNFLLREMGAPT